jgi:hypothetical protein
LPARSSAGRSRKGSSQLNGRAMRGYNVDGVHDELLASCTRAQQGFCEKRRDEDSASVELIC